MTNGGMIQLQRTDGTWKDCFPASYKTHDACWSVATKYAARVRLVDRHGRVLFTADGTT